LIKQLCTPASLPRLPAPLRTALLALGIALFAAGCGSSAASQSSAARHANAQRSAAAHKPAVVTLRLARTIGPLPSARSGIAAAAFGPSIFVSGGLSAAGASTDTIFRIDRSGSATTAGTLPGPIHDATSAALGGTVLVFGGGESEGSDRIVQLIPGPPRLIGSLPQALSDLAAVSLGTVAYVVGGWNGTDTNHAIYAAQPNGTASQVGTIPLGVRYPALAALGGRVIVAGGETAAGTPTADAWSFDPGTRKTTPLPSLPIPTDHTAGAVLNGRVYVIGGLRNGVFTDAILSWAPGERRWRSAGHLPAAISDLAAVAFDGGIAVVGGRGSGGQVSTVTLMKAG
jgi:hypothetical protein